MASSPTDQNIYFLGFKLDPDESEIVRLLKGKESGCINDEGFHFIKEIQLYNHQPWDLSSLAQKSGDEKMYFTTRLQYKKNQKGKIFNRQTKNGEFWKKTGGISDIKDKDGKPIARMTSLAYCDKDKQSKPVNHQWLMKEYRLITESESKMEPWTLCVVYCKPPKQ